MKLTVRIDGQEFTVEVDNLNARPILARIDDEVFEIMPEAGKGLTDEEKITASLASPVPHAQQKPSPLQNPAGAESTIVAPIPGVIEKIMVKEGDTVRRGQEMLILEAMKMKNAIRSPRDGRISAVRVSVGEIVKHNDILLEFSEGREG